MEYIDVLDSKSVKRFAKSLLWIIALLAVFACGFAALILLFGENLKSWYVFLLIVFLAIFPLIVFFRFLSFVKQYYKTLHEFSVDKYYKIHKEKASLLVSKAINLAKAIAAEAAKTTTEKEAEAVYQNQKNTVKELQKQLEEIFELLSKTSSGEN